MADKVEDFTVSSCLTLLCSVNGCSVTTSEGLGSSKSGFHPIHKRFAGFHASQCGFCTPGMCMSLFSALVNANKADRPEPPKGFSKLTVSEAERAIAGNLCRCTGYRPIADVCKSFASDVDMEDLGFNSFWRKGDSKQVMLDKLPRYDPSTDICTFPEFLKKENRLLNLNGYSWHTPGNLKELRSLLLKSDESIKLVVGNTSVGYYKEIENFDRYFNLRQVPELSMIRRDQTGVEIGAAVTISRVIQALNEEDDSPRLMVFKRIANHLEKIATVFIRNSASIGGNLVMAQRNYFPSDISTVLLSVGATVDIMSSHKCESVTLEDFLKMPPLCSRSILLSIKIPNPYLGSKGVLFFETYRAAPRPLGSALPHLNAAFLAEVAPCNTSDGIRINNSQLAFGSYGTKHAVRARKVEEFLIGKVLSVSVIYEATKLVRATVVPDYGTSSPAYRSSLAIGYLFEFLSSLTRKRIETSGNCLDGYKNGFSFKGLEVEQNNYQGDQTKLQTMISSAKQVIGLSSEYHPVGEPVTKAGAAVQASGLLLF